MLKRRNSVLIIPGKTYLCNTLIISPIIVMPLQKQIILLSFIFLSIVFSKAEQQSEKIIALTSDSTNSKLFSQKNISLTDSIINYGKLFLNTPYQYGSSGTESFDCSGFTSHVYRNFGYNLQRCSMNQAQQFDSVQRDQLKAGDLVFFGGRNKKSKRVEHVGIVVSAKEDGEFEFIHAAVRKGVTISNSSEEYYTKRFLKANRVVNYNPLLTISPSFAQSENSTNKEVTPIPFSEKVKQTRKVIPAEYYRVKRGETLSSIARKIGMPIEELKQKNDVKNSTIRPNQQLLVKEEETVMIYDSEPTKTMTASSDKTTNTTIKGNTELASTATNTSHTIVKGESLFSISKKYNISIDDLKRINNLNGNNLQLGQKIILSETTELAKNKTTKDDIENIQTTANHKVISGKSHPKVSEVEYITIDELNKMSNTKLNNTALGQEQKLSQPVLQAVNNTHEEKVKTEIEKTTHKVNMGESLFSISKKYNLSIDELKSINNLNSNNLQLGQELKIKQPTQVINYMTTENNERNGTHKVKPGESFFSIAKSYGCTVEKLKEWNKKTSNKINIGETLIIHPKNS